jgi:predicted MFS family arabinose efflux permease
MALAGNWPLAAVLIMAERTGRALRKPSTEAMLAHAGHQVGQGWVFGVNEALDQVGATIGPLIMALVLLVKGGYRLGYALLAIPAAVTIATILVARRWFPRPSDLEAGRPLDRQGLSRRYWYYVVAAGCVAAGFADFALIGYHFQKMSVISPTLIPVYYAVAMGAGAIGALALGRLYEINQPGTVLGAFLAAAFFAPLVFLGGPLIALGGMVLWGIGLAAQESLLRSVVAGIVDASRRATAFGLFDTAFGIAWFIGSLAMGYLYGISIPGLIIFSVLLQLIALPLLAFAGLRPGRKAPTPSP